MSPISNHSCSLVLQVFLITMLTVITWNQDSKQLHQCSRERSRIVREVITKKWLPIFDQHHVAISTECPFHLDRDYLWWPSDHKEADDDKVHDQDRNDKLYRDDVVCLAEYCDIFRCDVLIGHKQQQKRNQNLMGYLSFGEEDSSQKCEPEKMALLEKSCHNVVRQCTITLEANVSEAQFSLVEEELIGSLCSFLTCEHYNDDLFAEESASRKVPITLFTVLGATMACGFCICYYLIWKFIQRGFVRVGEKLPIENVKQKQTRSLKLSFRESAKAIMKSSANNSNNHTKSENFFNNIFEFNQEHKEDTIEFNNEFNANNTADYERKLRSISSIIEEEDEEKDDSERSISYASYPIVNRKFMVKQRSFEIARSSLADHSVSRSSHGSLTPTSVKSTPPMGSDGQIHRKVASHRPQSQEIYLHDLPMIPMKVHPKYIQPLKHSYSDRYPCYSNSPADQTVPGMTKSRSYSHSQLRNAHNSTVRTVFRPRMPPPVRQDSIEEEWEQKSQHSHSSMSLQSSISAVKSAETNGKGRNISKSALSYSTSMHSNPNKEDHHQVQPYSRYQSQSVPYHQPFQPHQHTLPLQQHAPHQQQLQHQVQHHQQHQFGTSSSTKSNSNASITSKASLGSGRMTSTSSQPSFVKR